MGWAIAAALAAPLPAMAQQQAGPTGDAQNMTSAEQTARDRAELKQLTSQLDQLKAQYVEEVRRMRSLDARVQALQARLAGRVPAGGPGPKPGATQSVAAAPEPQTGNEAEANQAQRKQTQSRSVEDVLQQQNSLFTRRFTIENGLTYQRYDRRQLTLNGFLALDAIFLGNIAIQDVKSDTLTYDLVGRWGVSPDVTLNLDIPYLARSTEYIKGGAGGSATALAQEKVTGSDIGDVSATINWRAFAETAHRPDVVLSFGATAPTGRAPYGINWNVLERNQDKYISFAVPSKQPTGNGVWQANLGVSMIKTLDPAIMFGNFGVNYPFSRHFNDLDNNPDTVNPGRVKLGTALYFGGGVAFAFNERTSLSLSFNDRIQRAAHTRIDGKSWQHVIASGSNAATFNVGVTYAMSQHTTLVTLLGVGMTPDAPDFTLSVKIPFIM